MFSTWNDRAWLFFTGRQQFEIFFFIIWQKQIMMFHLNHVFRRQFKLNVNFCFHENNKMHKIILFICCRNCCLHLKWSDFELSVVCCIWQVWHFLSSCSGYNSGWAPPPVEPRPHPYTQGHRFLFLYECNKGGVCQDTTWCPEAGWF